MTKVGVLLMAYGTPRSQDEILPYYTDIRRGRPPTPELLAELTARYDAIGGISPLAQRTESQREELQRQLDVLEPGRFTVRLGLKHAHPMIEEAVEGFAKDGFTELVALVLAPHFSSYSIGQYVGRAREAAAPHGIDVRSVDSWATEPAFIDFIANDMRHRLASMPSDTRVLFTAHSLPQRIIDGGDPYPNELRSTAEAVASAIGLRESDQWSIAWQSAGRTPEPWIGPDILTVIDELADARSTSAVLVSACGFVADHLEVLYDLDIEAKAHAAARGLGFDRTACVNDDPVVMQALARRVTASVI